ncbi:SRPBCC family protein [Chloroflexota bacterium]
MVRIDNETILKVPLENLFDYINKPENFSEIWTSLINVSNIKSLPNGGYSSQWIYKMAGRHFKGVGKCTRISPNRLIVIESKGGIKSTITWTFRSDGNITKVTLTIEYKIPIPLLGKLAEAIIVKMNEQEMNMIMDNLKARFMNTKPRNTLSKIPALS